ncbi:MAG TPA: DUF397 domain-containing protein [Pseudonocardia sp.]|nr:DUF397 domain-containing protein [Pseudonocardia sp.]
MAEPGSRSGAHFRTSSYSGGGSCVEVGRLADGSVAVRHSRSAAADVMLVFTADEWAAFVSGVKAGEFDLA